MRRACTRSALARTAARTARMCGGYAAASARACVRGTHQQYICVAPSLNMVPVQHGALAQPCSYRTDDDAAADDDAHAVSSVHH